jgi:hypothetical protein
MRIAKSAYETIRRHLAYRTSTLGAALKVSANNLGWGAVKLA